MSNQQRSSHLIFVSAAWCRRALLLLLASLPSGLAVADDDIPDTVREFPLSYFDTSQPRTALDLVTRLPGFAIDGGDSDVRGYAGSTGNVMIDGQRPVSKSGSITDALSRIPAEAVEKVELIRGSTRGIDMQGQTVVANVVRRAEASSAIRAMISARLYESGQVRPEAQLEGIRNTPRYTLEGTLNVYDMINGIGSGYRRRVDTNGDLLRYATTRTSDPRKGFAATSAFQRPLYDGNLRMTASLGAVQSDEAEINFSTYPIEQVVSFTEHEDIANAELGVSYGHDLGQASRAELLAIQQLYRSDKVENEAVGPDITMFSQMRRRGESILRGTIRTTLPSGSSFEWGIEAAYNFLKSDAAATENGAAVLLPAARVNVEEQRGELFGRLSWSPGPGIAAEVSLALEASRISQDDIAASSRSLVYPKPRALFSWNPSDAGMLRLSLQRTVGQLDFNDFASSATLSTSTVNIGNADLVPFTSWDLRASWEQALTGEATIIFSLFTSRISDVVDIAPVYIDTDGDGIPETFEGVGNIGDGSQSELAVDLNLPLDWLGVPGGLIKSYVGYVRSSVDDPVTGMQRRISDMKYPWDGRVAFTQDLPLQRLRWGVNMWLGASKPEYRIEEVRIDTKEAWVDMFAEFFPNADWMLGLSLHNLTKRSHTLTRTLYGAPRNIGMVAATDVDYTKADSSVRLYVRREFR